MRIAITACLSLLAACQGQSEGPRTSSQRLAADIVLINGKIITVDSDDSIVEALAIHGGRIVGLGSSEEITSLADGDTEVVDLRGNTVTPGIIDSHIHFAGTMVARMNDIDLSGSDVTSIGDVARMVAEKVGDLPAGQWVRGGGWDEGKLAEQRYIEASDLDSASPNNPVWLMHTMGHYGVVNSAGLELAGITAETPDPPGGTIERYADGRPTGVLKESAMDLVTNALPGYTLEQIDRAIELGARALNAEGITAIKDPSIDLERWEAYQRALARGALTLRVFTLWRTPDTVEAAEELVDRIGPFTRPYVSTGDDRLISGGIKIVADGSGGARTAWMYEDWNKDFNDVDTGNRGYPLFEPELLERLISLYHEAGLHLGIHAIGDRAIDFVVDSYLASLEKVPTIGLRHTLIHGNIPTDHALDVLVRLQRDYDAGYPEVQANFMWWIGDTYAGNFGPERTKRLKPLATFADRGIRFGGGSDFGVTPFASRYGLWSSIARETLNGVHGRTPFGTDESIDIRTALRSYTSWNSPLLFLEDEIGTLEVGKYADLVVWDTDLYSASPGSIKEMRALMTFVEGEIVYQSSDAVTPDGA